MPYTREQIREEITKDISTVVRLYQKFSDPKLVIRNSLGALLNTRDTLVYRASKLDELRTQHYRLSCLLAAQVVPRQYTSCITGKMYQLRQVTYQRYRNLSNANYYSFCNKRSRHHHSDVQRSHFSVQDHTTAQHFEFEIEHDPKKQYGQGGFADRVKRAYVGNEDIARYVVKIFKPTVDDEMRLQRNRRMAMRAVYAERLLGRDAYSFDRNEKQYLVLKWQPGTPLAKVEPDTLSRLSVKERIRLVLDLTEQLACLHRAGLIHNDIKPANLLLSDSTLTLIDLDSVTLERAPNDAEIVFTPTHVDPRIQWYRLPVARRAGAFDKHNDLFAMGLTIATLFPEFFTLTCERKRFVHGRNVTRYYEAAIKTIDESNVHTELMGLIQRLCSEVFEHRHESIMTFKRDLMALYIKKYEGQPEDVIAIEADPNLPNAEDALKSIDIEMIEYNERYYIWRRKTIAASESKQEAHPDIHRP